MIEEKRFFKLAIEKEVYGGAATPFFHKLYRKYCMPQFNSVYLIRKMCFYHSLATKYGRVGSILNLLSLHYRNKLIRKYGMDINKDIKIGIGLRVPHPHSIVMGPAVIGNNFTILHNTTVGSLRDGESLYMKKPDIGDDCIMYANCMVLGPIHITNHVSIGCFSCLMKDALEGGTYVGCPAKLVNRKEK